MMTRIFLHIINMSITASYVVLAILLLRLIIKKAPKWINVALWGIVALRLVCPFSIESVISLIPSAQTISPEIMTDQTPEINTGIPAINNTLNPVISESLTPMPSDSANPLQVLIPIFTVIWFVGMATLLIYAVISYMRVKRRIGTAVLYNENIYQSENVISPFVLGFFKPKIYLPFSMNERDMFYVIAHEKAHIRRKDHVWKPLGFLLLAVYWFNPLIWLSYVLLCRDIELACDERVISELEYDARADYSAALLACSVNRRMIAACPLAFGEVGVTERVKSVLNYKKPAFWIIVVVLIACAFVAVCFLTNPKAKNDPEESNPGETNGETENNGDTAATPNPKPENRGETDPSKLSDEQIALMKSYPEYFGLNAANGLDVYVWQMAANSYNFGLTAHGEPIGLFPKGMSSDNMRHALDTYDIDASNIYIIPWMVAHSSYLGDFWIFWSGEDTEEKKAAFDENIWELLSEQRTYETESGTPDLVYANPTLSWVDSYYSGIKIIGDALYDLESGEHIGTLSRKYLNSIDLDSKLCENFTPYEGLGNKIRHSTLLSYEVRLTNAPRNVDLYYVIIQNDGTALLVYGHYENGVKNDQIRWIFNVGE